MVDPRTPRPRRVSWPLVVAALLCLVPVVGGVLLITADGSGGEALGFALVGFFGAGVFALGRSALRGGGGHPG